MKRAAILLFPVFTIACEREPLAPELQEPTPLMEIVSDGGGGVSFAPGSGCTVVSSPDFECNYTIEGAGTHTFHVLERGIWTYQYQCLHRKTLKPSNRGPITGITSTQVPVGGLVPTDGRIELAGRTLAPQPPTDCEAGNGAYSVTQLLSGFTPHSWSLFAESDLDANYWASLFEVL